MRLTSQGDHIRSMQAWILTFLKEGEEGRLSEFDESENGVG